MFKTILPGNNIVYHFIPYKNLDNHIHLIKATNCTLYIARLAQLQNCRIFIHGNNSSLFIGDSLMGNADIFVYEKSCVYIGNRIYINGHGGRQAIRCSGHSNIIIGNNCAISTDVEITTTDVHLIYDKNTRARINTEASIFIGDHVWLSREVKVFKKARISSGCICAARSIVTGHTYPPNSLISGVPGIIRKAGEIFWLSPSSYFFSEEEIKHYSLLEENNPMFRNACYIHTSGESISATDLETTLKSQQDSHSKISFLYDRLYSNCKHNRFAWMGDNNEPKLLEYKDRLSTLPVTSPPLPQKEENINIASSDIFVLLYERKIRRKLFFYRLMSHITFGQNKAHYKSKKKFLRQVLNKIDKLKITAERMFF